MPNIAGENLIVASAWVSPLALTQVEKIYLNADAILPEQLSYDCGKFAAVEVYQGNLSMVKHQHIWRSFSNKEYSNIVVIGSGSFVDNADAICIGAYLNSNNLFYAELKEVKEKLKVINITKSKSRIKQDLHKHTVSYYSLNSPNKNEYLQGLNHKYIDLVISNNYLIPTRENKQSEVIEHFQQNVGLAQDLILRVPELSGEPWCTYETESGELVYSIDYNLAFANFIGLIPDIQSVLDVGCGSGFVPLYLTAKGSIERVAGADPVQGRIEGAKLLAELSGIDCEFFVMGADRLDFPDKSFDVVVTSYALEQCNEILEKALSEIFRVARKYVILLEPSIEFRPTLPGIVHILHNGYPQNYIDLILQHSKAFSLRKPLLRHYGNSGAIYFINMHSQTQPHLLFPNLFRQDLWSSMSFKEESEFLSINLNNETKVYGYNSGTNLSVLEFEQESEEFDYEPPKLIEDFGIYNIVAWKNNYYGLPKQLGEVNLQEIKDQKQLELILIGDSIAELKNMILDRHKFEDLNSNLSSTQAELLQVKMQIQAMESSKFWKLRQLWHQIKKTVRSK